MAYDIKINLDRQIFKYRVSGVLIQNDKILTVQMMDNGFYCLPGGHVKFGEFSNDSVKREFEEEVKIPVIVKEPLAVIESIFKRKDGIEVHEIGITYILEKKEELKILLDDYTITENDDGIEKKLNFKWIDLNKLDDYDFRPSLLKEQLKNKDFSFKHYITN